MGRKSIMIDMDEKLESREIIRVNNWLDVK